MEREVKDGGRKLNDVSDDVESTASGRVHTHHHGTFTRTVTVRSHAPSPYVHTHHHRTYDILSKSLLANFKNFENLANIYRFKKAERILFYTFEFRYVKVLHFSFFFITNTKVKMGFP